MFNNALAAGVMNNCRVPNSTPHMNSFLYMLSRMGRHACLPVFHLDLHIPPWSKIACHVQCCSLATFFLQESLKYSCFHWNFVLEMYSSATRVLLDTRVALVTRYSYSPGARGQHSYSYSYSAKCRGQHSYSYSYSRNSDILYSILVTRTRISSSKACRPQKSCGNPSLGHFSSLPISHCYINFHAILRPETQGLAPVCIRSVSQLMDPLLRWNLDWWKRGLWIWTNLRVTELWSKEAHETRLRRMQNYET